MADKHNDPPLSTTAAAAWTVLGWLMLIGMVGGTAWWCCAFRRVIRAG